MIDRIHQPQRPGDGTVRRALRGEAARGRRARLPRRHGHGQDGVRARQEYTHGPLPLFHFDLYRIRDVYDLESTGFYDYLDRGGVLFIEWSENAAGALPPETICVCFERIDDDTRLIMLEGGPF